MKLPRLPVLPGLSGSSFTDPRFLATAATAAFILAGIVGLVVLGEGVALRNAEADDLRGRLEVLMSRPLPKPAAAKPSEGSEGDMRMFSGATEGEAVAAMQAHLTSIVDGAGLRLRRMAVENSPGEENSHQLAVSIDARGGTNALQTALFQIETGFPYLEVTLLDVQRASGETGDSLDIQATITAQWREVKS